MLRVVHFEINCDQPERAVEFYAKVFGWKIQKWEGPMDYWLITTGDSAPGIDGGLMQRMAPSAHTINTIDVPSADEFAAKIEKAGGKIIVPKATVPGIGYLAYCQDTEGNVFGNMQEDSSAK